MSAPAAAFVVSHGVSLGQPGDALDLGLRLYFAPPAQDGAGVRFATALRHSACGTWLLAGCNDGTVLVWDSTTLALAAVLSAHDGPVMAIAELPAAGGGRDPVVVTAGADGAVRVWSIATAQVLRAVAAPSTPLCVATTLVAAGGGGGAPSRLVAVGCAAHAPFVFDADSAVVVALSRAGEDAGGSAGDVSPGPTCPAVVASCAAWSRAAPRAPGVPGAAAVAAGAARLLVGTPSGDVFAFLVSRDAAGAWVAADDGELPSDADADERSSVKALRVLRERAGERVGGGAGALPQTEPTSAAPPTPRGAESRLLVVRFDGSAAVVDVAADAPLGAAPLPRPAVALPGARSGANGGGAAAAAAGDGEHASWRDVDARGDGGVVIAAERGRSLAKAQLRVAVWDAVATPAAAAAGASGAVAAAGGSPGGAVPSAQGPRARYRALPRPSLTLPAESATDCVMAVAHHAFLDTVAVATRAGRLFTARREAQHDWTVWAPLLRVPELMRNREYVYDDARDALAFAPPGGEGGTDGDAAGGSGRAPVAAAEGGMDVEAPPAVAGPASDGVDAVIALAALAPADAAVAAATAADASAPRTAATAAGAGALPESIDVLGDGVGAGGDAVLAAQRAPVSLPASRQPVDVATGQPLVPVGTFAPFALPLASAGDAPAGGGAAAGAPVSLPALHVSTAYMLAPSADGDGGDGVEASGAPAPLPPGAVVHGLIAEGVRGIVSITRRDVPIYWLAEDP